jgi:flap endonuclease-1
MGVNLEPILVKHKTALKDFSGNTVSVDAYNMLYQFLSGIRQPDGTPLMDANGNVTSHLSGIFYRTIALMEEGIKPVYVFDGKPSPMKLKTLEERKLLRERNEEELERAIAMQDVEKIARLKRTINRITIEMIEESKHLLEYMGLPYVQAPSEGEAQASVMNGDGIVQAVISQDYDCLLFGAKRVLRNFTIYGRRRISSRNIYISVDPEYIDLQENLEILSINRDQLIDIGILVGTDFNDGVRKVGPKTALNLIKKHGNIESVIKEKNFEIPELEKVREIFTKPQADHDVKIKFGSPDREKIIDFLCGKHSFSSTRVEPYIEKLTKSLEKGNQFNLDSFF